MYLGQCLCAKVKVMITGGISDIIHCHCSLCRKNSGTAFATNGYVNATDLKFVSGKNNLTTYSFKEGRYRHFCSSCGSPVYSSSDDDKTRYRLRLGLLDSEITERPISHNFVSSKASWEDLDADLPRSDSFEVNRT